MRIYNSLTRNIEAFAAINPPSVGMYTCGPTVYSYATIGNWRTYMLGDLVYRVLRYMGYDVSYVMNITDVGHLTGDNLGDADIGDDRLEEAAKKEGKTAWDVASFYTDDFKRGFEALHFELPKVLAKATDHIAEQIEMIKAIEQKGMVYRIADGIYFDTKAYEAAGNRYGELSTLDEIKAGVRVEPNLEKKDARDFALWKFSPAASSESSKRQMEWGSPWGVGFPGWHIECSAMSAKYLGEQFDLHLGGEDLRSTHHPNEIAQTEAATGKKPFVKYWVHGAFITVDGGRMGKSLGNAYTLQDVEAKGFDPMDLRYFYMTGHYRKQLNFTWEALKAAREARLRLVQLMQEFRKEQERTILSEEKLKKVDDYRQRFMTAINEDLNMPQALAVVWEVVKSNIPGEDKFDLIREMDEVMGLQLQVPVTSNQIPEKTMPGELRELLSRREEMRRAGKFQEADEVRKQIEGQGYVVEDGPQGVTLRRV
jgi:cysteinyl-tRNA synthetase